MISNDILDGIKLVVDESYFATDEEISRELESAFQQGSQGWGVKLHQGVYFTLARALRAAKVQATTADEAQRALKGAQMELGRVKKQREVLQLAQGGLEIKLLAKENQLFGHKELLTALEATVSRQAKELTAAKKIISHLELDAKLHRVVDVPE